MTVCHSVVIASPGVIAVENIEIPPIGTGQCLVRATCSLISSGTELVFFQGTHSSVVAGITTMMFDWHILATAALRMMFQLISTSDEANSLPVRVSIPAFLRKDRTT